MAKRKVGEMKYVILAYALVLSGCSGLVSTSAICDGTKALRTLHAGALVDDGGDKSVVTGQALIATIDAGCDDA